jgi:TolB-like protein
MDVPEGSGERQVTGVRSGAADVFISYASSDRSAADAVCGALEDRGVTCWIAPRDVVPGEFYADAIVRAIDAARIVVLVLSQHAVGSPHVIREVERAASKRHPIVAFRIDTAAMPPALEYFLNASHWLDASASGYAASVPKLTDAVARLVASGSGSSGAPRVAQELAGGSAPAAPQVPPGTKSIAVLPFANMSAEQDQEYFSDGLAEEIINLLAHSPGLKVIARTSAFAFRGKEQDVRGIAAALGVTHVLEGSVRRAGSRLRVTGQLIQAADGTHLWSERYDRELSDIFAVQDEISEAIVAALRIAFSAGAAPHRYTPKLAAYEAYLKARYLAAKVTPESLELARQCYEQAIELDGNLALAHVGLGNYWVSVITFGGGAAQVAVPAARAQAQRALQIDPSLPEAHALLGVLAAIYDLDWAAAERHFDFPMAKQAGITTLRPMYGWLQFMCGNMDRAIELARREIQEDPLDVWPRMNLHAYLQAAGREPEALEQLKKVLELDEHQVVAMVSMAMIYADRGDLAQALVIARRAHATAPWYPDTIAVLAALTRRNGEAVESQSLVQALGAGDAIGDAPAHALLHLLCGELDPGADWAEKAIAQRSFSMMIYLRFAVCRELRASARWPRIARMLNL